MNDDFSKISSFYSKTTTTDKKTNFEKKMCNFILKDIPEDSAGEHTVLTEIEYDMSPFC